MKIALILPTFNNHEDIIKCVKSIDENANQEKQINIIWVDKNSNLNCKKQILDSLNECKNIKYDNIFLNNDSNFAKAVNIGIKFCQNTKYDYIGILNNVVKLSEKWLDNLINALELDKDNVLAGGMEYLLNISSINNFELFESSDLESCNASSFEETAQNVEKLNLESITYTFDHFNDYKFLNGPGVSYTCVLCKPIIFSKVGLLNENFDSEYSDDTEFNFRLTKAGYKIVKARNVLILRNRKQNNKIVEDANKLQLKISKTLNQSLTKKYVIYTAIIDDYDDLKTPNVVNTDEFDYVCFTNSSKIFTQDVSPWIIINISNIIENINVDSHVKWARYFKTHPHLFFENYEKSIWIDANINVINDPLNYLENLKDGYILVPDHPIRNDIYEEIIECQKIKKDDLINLKNIQRFLINEGYPGIKGKLTQTGILLRNHHNLECKYLMEKWWYMIENYSKRDQLSFNYVFWKYNGQYMSIPWDLISLKYFTTNYLHNGKNK